MHREIAWLVLRSRLIQRSTLVTVLIWRHRSASRDRPGKQQPLTGRRRRLAGPGCNGIAGRRNHYRTFGGRLLTLRITCRLGRRRILPIDCSISAPAGLPLSPSSWQLLQPKFHYGDFFETSPFRGSRRSGIWAKGDVTGSIQHGGRQ